VAGGFCGGLARRPFPQKNNMAETIKFTPGETYELTLAYDTPKTGEGANGPWTLYGCEEEKSFFATARLDELLRHNGASKGTRLHIFKEELKAPHRVWIDGAEVFPPPPSSGPPVVDPPFINGPAPKPTPQVAPRPMPAPAAPPQTPKRALGDDTLVVLAARLRVAQALAGTVDAVEREATQNTILIELNKAAYVAPDHILGAAHQHLVALGIIQAESQPQAAAPVPDESPPPPQFAPVDEDLPF
jgi:hypothetical protein